MNNDTASSTTRLLLIEDNPSDLYLLKYALGKQHYKLTSLHDGAEALAFIRKQGKYADAEQPDLIVMDLHLPKFDGMEVLEEIHRTRTFAHLPVAVLSSSVSPHEKNRIAALEATLISKPLDLDDYAALARTIRVLSLKGIARAAGGATS